MEHDWAVREMSGANLGDPRQVQSVIRVCLALEEHPSLSFTAACGPAVRQAAHRIFEHPETSVEGLLAGHYLATAARCQEFPRVLIAQDTCTFVYKQAQIVGLAELNQSKRSRGLLGHAALALTPVGTPLGLLHLDLWGGDSTLPPLRPGEVVPLAERESYKWHLGLQAVAQRLPAETEGVLIQDREGDIFPLFVAPRPTQLHLLVRAAHDRSIRYETLPTPNSAVGAPVGRSTAPNPDAVARVSDPTSREPPAAAAAAALRTPNSAVGAPVGRSTAPSPDAAARVSDPTGREPPAVAAAAALRTERGHLFAVAAAAPVWGQLRVSVPAKPRSPQQPRQPAREAELEVRVAEVRLQRPRGDTALAALPQEAPVWVLYVEETTAGIDPAERLRWVLLTTLPVTNWAEAYEVVGYYARRWTIERLHYTLKSGLGAEKLQIDDATSLSHALALHYVVACRLLQLTYLARHDPEHPALDVLSPDEVAVLSMAEGKPIRTVAAAVLAIAKQGGYAPYRTAPPPGVKVLWLGLQRLHGMALGWRLARTANAGGTAG